MPREWTSSPDLHLDLDVAAGGGRRAALESALRDAIQRERLAAGTPLPSTRRLAHDLGYARGTVLDAYAQLVSEGYLVAQPGGSTRVASGVGANTSLTTARGAARRDVPTKRFDLRPGVLDLGRTFPRAEWLKSVRAAMTSSPDAAFGYGDPRGRIELRDALASYLGRARGVVTAPDNIIVCRGFGHGLELASRALHEMGAQMVAMEDPCLPAHRQLVQRTGLGIAPMRVDARGADPAAITADAAVVTPAHQYPTGVTLHAARRAALVAWARESGGVIIEDDYDGEFRYDRQPVGAVQGLAPDDVVYIGTTSKTLAPGVGVGWMVAPSRYVDVVVDAMGPRPGGDVPPALEQLTLADFIERGRLDRHLRRLRISYRRRRDLVLSQLARVKTPLEPLGIAAGLHVTIPFEGTPLREKTVAAHADRLGLEIATLSPHHHGRGAGGLVVGFAGPTETGLHTATDLLVRALRDSL